MEDLKEWWRKARPPLDEEGNPLYPPEEEYVSLWETVVGIIQTAFETGDIPTAFTEGTLVLIPKNKKGQYRGIALLDCVYKFLSCIKEGDGCGELRRRGTRVPQRKRDGNSDDTG